jgi:hypothetical protein
MRFSPSLKKRTLFHFAGVLIVALWLTMIGSLVNRIHYGDQAKGQNHSHGKIPIKSPQREWKEIFFKDRKVGYAVNLIKPFKSGYFIQEEIFLRLNLLGMGNSVYTLTQSQVDENFLLNSFYFSMTSGVVRFQVFGDMDGDDLVLQTGSGKGLRKQRIPLENRPMIGAGMAHYFKSRALGLGETFRLPFFDPSTMAHRDVLIRVAAKEPVKIHNRIYDAYRLEADIFGKILTFWIHENGDTLKEEGFMGLTTIKSSPSRAPFDLEDGEGLDLYDVTAIKLDRPLHETKRMTYLKLKAEGADPSSLNPVLWHDGRQKIDGSIIEIHLEKQPLNASNQLPFDGRGDELKPFLKAEFNIESDNEEVIKLAETIVGETKNPISSARKCLHWVYKNLEKRPVVSVPSALEVLRTRQGDCNEHATLLTALLRAAGVPARITIGLVYSRQKFYYHAWTEAHIGSWVSLDATLNQMPADVTHIKLLEGNLDEQVKIAKMIGNLKLEILDYRYD